MSWPFQTVLNGRPQNGERQWVGLSEGGISCNVSTPYGPKWAAQSGKERRGLGGCWEVGGRNVQVFSLQTALNGRPGADKRKGGFGGGRGKCASDVTSDGPKWTARSNPFELSCAQWIRFGGCAGRAGLFWLVFVLCHLSAEVRWFGWIPWLGCLGAAALCELNGIYTSMFFVEMNVVPTSGGQ